MLPSSEAPSTSDRSRQLKRYGPFVAILAVVLVAGIVAVASGGGKDKKDDGKVATGATTTVAGSGLAKGAISFAQAKKEGLKVTFPDTCDEKTGKVKLPYYFAADCFANVADNGGATSPGVTKDSVTLVIYIPTETDAVLDFITAAIKNNDTTAQLKETWQGYADLYNSLYQTYGRKIDLKFLDASGESQDEVAARADAVKAAEQYKAFAVLGGPVLTSAFADELAARKVICVGCTAGGSSFYEKRSPYLYGVGMNGQQVLEHVVEYVSKKLGGRKAEFAGSPELKAADRKIGYLWIESNDDSKTQADLMAKRLAEKGVKLAESVPYTLDPARLQEQATSAITKMKNAGVTTIMFSGDPVAPTTFTQEATAQNYFPEWLLGPSSLVDTTAFARTYDQKQWAHAFGVSPGAVRLDPNKTPSFFLYQWFKGEDPPAKDTNAVMFPNMSTFAGALQAAGPDLTPENFQKGIFAREPSADVISQPSVSWGNHGLWDYTDFNGVDDATEIWWDPNSEGPDEIRKQGKGQWQYVDGGKRYLPGKWTTDESKAFDPAGAVARLDKPPADETPPDYPSPK